MMRAYTIILQERVTFLKLKGYRSTYHEDVRHYVQTEELLRYTGTPQDNIAISATTPTHHSILVYEKNQLVCFFALDEGALKTQYTSEPSAFVLRSFSTDARYLRRGYGKKALMLLPDFVRNQFPDIKEIVLGVNQNNLPAQALYEKVGFVANGRILQGPKGPQNILMLSI